MAGAVSQPPKARDLGEKLKKRGVLGETLAISIHKYREDEDAEGVRPARDILQVLPTIARAVPYLRNHRAATVRAVSRQDGAVGG